MKIGFASRWDPRDKRSWSGIGYSTFSQMARDHDTTVFFYKWPFLLREYLTMQKSLNRKISGKHTVVEFLASYARYFSKRLEQDLERNPVDLLFVLASPQLLSHLRTSIPVIYMTDATFFQIQGYYPYFSNLPAYNKKQGIRLDKSAFENATHCMLTSWWNRDSAVNDYHLSPEKISVVHMGANLEAVPTREQLASRSTGLCRMLFLAVEWERKGGETALQAFYELKKMGHKPTLHIIGCVPPHDLSGETDITVIPFLDKNKASDFNRLFSIMLETDFLVLPTMAECTGIVFCEASAFGFPSITIRTGGIPDYVVDGQNGYTLPPGSDGKAFAAIISRICNDHKLESQLREGSRLAYEQKLNWETWGMHFNKIAKALTSK